MVDFTFKKIINNTPNLAISKGLVPLEVGNL